MTMIRATLDLLIDSITDLIQKDNDDEINEEEIQDSISNLVNQFIFKNNDLSDDEKLICYYTFIDYVGHMVNLMSALMASIPKMDKQ